MTLDCDYIDCCGWSPINGHMNERKEERMGRYYHFIHTFIQETFVKHLLCVKPGVR